MQGPSRHTHSCYLKCFSARSWQPCYSCLAWKIVYVKPNNCMRGTTPGQAVITGWSHVSANDGGSPSAPSPALEFSLRAIQLQNHPSFLAALGFLVRNRRGHRAHAKPKAAARDQGTAGDRDRQQESPSVTEEHWGQKERKSKWCPGGWKSQECQDLLLWLSSSKALQQTLGVNKCLKSVKQWSTLLNWSLKEDKLGSVYSAARD